MFLYTLVFLFGVFIGNGFLVLGIDVIDRYMITKIRNYFKNRKMEKNKIIEEEKFKKHVDKYVDILKNKGE